MIEPKLITFGSGSASGVMNATYLKQIKNAGNLNKIKAAGYTGIVFNFVKIEGTYKSLAKLMNQTFAAASRAGLQVIVSTTHTAPVGAASAKDRTRFVKAWAKNAWIDVISPQLYANGDETSPEFAGTWSCQNLGGMSCTWDLYKNAKARFVPTIVDASQYDEVEAYFANKGIETTGFFQWA